MLVAPLGIDLETQIDSDVMIDFELAFRNSEPRIELPRFESGVITTPSEENEEEANELNGFGFDDDEYYNARWFDFLQSTNLLEAHSMDTRERDVMILLSYRVYGYVLLNRKWCKQINIVHSTRKYSDNS